MTAVPHWDLVGPADTDADLARAAAAGDRSAFAGIYDRYADRLHDYCVGMLRDRDDAADCVQDAFCTAATRLNQLRDADKLRPWLYAIARNEALRRLRDRRRETVSDDLPETVSQEPGPDTLAARTELADLISDAAGGLSDRDRSILELTYRHGLDGPDLAEALNVSPVNATKMVQRLRDTVERSLGALLVARRIRNTGRGCAELAMVLDGWDGHFTVLMRKRIARHIEACPTCHDDRQHLVSPVALLGATPAFIPAPGWLRERTLNEIELTPSTTPIPPEQACARGRVFWRLRLRRSHREPGTGGRRGRRSSPTRADGGRLARRHSHRLARAELRVDAAAEERHRRPCRCEGFQVGDGDAHRDTEADAEQSDTGAAIGDPTSTTLAPRRRPPNLRFRRPRTRLRRREPSHRIRPPLSRSRYRSPLPNRMCPIRACRPPTYPTMPWPAPTCARSRLPVSRPFLRTGPQSSRRRRIESPPPAPKPPTRRAINGLPPANPDPPR